MRTRGWAVFVIVVLVFAVSFLLRECGRGDVVELSGKRERIVALSPSTVEVLFELGLGDRVVGVSRFTTYPPEAVRMPKVGGFLDVDVEALVSLKPDVVVLLREQRDLEERLRGMGIETVWVEHASVEGMMDSVKELGEFFDVEERAGEVVDRLEARIGAVRDRVKEGERPRVLVSFGRECGQGKVTSLVAAGAAGYHRELVELAGGVNAYEGAVAYPELSREHVLRMNPDVIIDMVPAKEFDAFGEEKLLADWAGMQELKAVREGRVFVLGADVHYVPGPRFVETLEVFSRFIQGGDGE